jgi:PAS domain S-box-containing protein
MASSSDPLMEHTHAQANEIQRDVAKESEVRLLRERDRLYHSIFETSAEGIVITTPDGHISFVNQQMADMTGFSVDEILGKASRDFILDVSNERIVEARKRLRKGKIITGEVKIRRKDGHTLWTLYNATPLFTDKGVHTGNLMMHMDITGQKKAQQTLQASELKLRHLVQYAPTGIYEIDFRVPRFISVNEAACSLSGYSKEELLAMNPMDLLDDAGKKQLQERIENVRAGKPIKESIDYTVIRKDGEERSVVLNLQPLYVEGKLESALVVAHDVTDRKRAEMILLESKEREHEHLIEIQTILDTVPATVWIAYDRECKKIVGNRVTNEMLGVAGSTNLSMSAPPNQRLATFRPYKSGRPVPPDELPMQKAARTGQPVSKSEFELWFSDGRRVNLYGNAAPLKNEGGVVRGAVGAFIDITEKVRAQEQVMVRSRELAAINKELESFSYSVAHDLRAPLRSINGYSHMLCEDYGEKLDDQGKRYLLKIQGSTQSMGELIDDILRLAKISRKEISAEQVNLSSLAETILRKLHENDPDREVHVHLGKDIFVYGDPSLLEILLENLLENAWKFTSKTQHPNIEFDKKIQDDHEVYFVKDNGAGFDSVYADKLFRPFERLHGVEEFPGTGVGLAIAKRIIDRHNGRIWATGAPGKGASFYFSLGL